MAVCPEGYFGEHCMETCNCKSEGFICSPAEGCICRYGHEGENCDRKISEPLGAGEGRSNIYFHYDF